MNYLINKTILIVSNEPWGEMWYSKHNYAEALSKNNSVIFVDPTEKYNFSGIFYSKFKLQQVKENLFVLKYKNALPSNQKRAMLFWVNEHIMGKRIKRFLKKQNYQIDIYWSFDPYRLLNPQVLNSQFSLFFYADDYKNRYLKYLLHKVDLILSISDKFIDSYIKSNKPWLVLKHSVPMSFFSNNGIQILPNSGKKQAVFIGSVDHRLDFEIVKTCVLSFTEIDFLFIGPVKKETLSTEAREFFLEHKPKNVNLLGTYPYNELKEFISLASICLAPMKTEVHGNAINHQKIIQYLAWGKPIVMPLFSDFKETTELFYIYSNQNDCIYSFAEALKETFGDPVINKRISFAEGFTFDKQLAKIDKFFTDHAHLFHNSQ